MKNLFKPFTDFISSIKTLVTATKNLSTAANNLNEKVTDTMPVIDDINNSVAEFNHKNEVPLKRIAKTQAHMNAEIDKLTSNLK